MSFRVKYVLYFQLFKKLFYLKIKFAKSLSHLIIHSINNKTFLFCFISNRLYISCKKTKKFIETHLKTDFSSINVSNSEKSFNFSNLFK